MESSSAIRHALFQQVCTRNLDWIARGTDGVHFCLVPITVVVPFIVATKPEAISLKNRRALAGSRMLCCSGKRTRDRFDIRFRQRIHQGLQMRRHVRLL